MLPATAHRVPEHTADYVNAQIRERTEERLRRYAAYPGGIGDRLRELDQEWDIERALEVEAATLALAGVALAVLHDRRWLALTAGAAAFMLQHALQGWCPPTSLYRRAGYRTEREIAEERYALKALRGDFASLNGGSPHTRARRALEAAAG